MNYGELVAAVLEQVPITHKEAYVRDKINQMIRYISGSGYFWRDIAEVVIGAADGVDAATYIQSITVSSLIRKLIYVRYAGTETTKIRVVDLRDLVGREECIHMDNVAYLSGTTLRIKNSKFTADFSLGYYTFPANFATDGTDDASENWITALAPGLVIDLTSSYLLNLKGDNEDASNMSQLANMLKTAYIRDFVTSV
jgi:hypothetical protein